MRVLIDMDEIAVDLLGEWLARYNKSYSDSLARAEVTDWDLHRFVKPECGKAVYGILSQPDLFENLPPVAGVVDAVTTMVEAGYDVRFCTSAPSPASMTPKANWVKHHFGHLDFGMSNIITMADKVWLAPSVDVLVDDKPQTITEWREYADSCSGYPPHILTISHPYNQNVSDKADLFALSYKNTEKAWKDITAYVNELAWTRRRRHQKKSVVGNH